MNEKEIGEIRRHLRRDRSNMTAIYGCFVNDNKEIISEYRASTGIMSENEADKYFAILRKALSGSVGKNLIDLTFKTSQVAGSPEHELLMKLRESKLQDEELRMTLYKKMIDTIVLEGNYLILLGCDAYDVPFKSKDDFLLYAFFHVGLAFLSEIFLVPQLRKYLKFIPFKELHPFKRFRHIFILFIPSIAVHVYYMIDRSMIGWITQDAFQNGYYEQALSVVRTILPLVTAVGGVLLYAP